MTTSRKKRRRVEPESSPQFVKRLTSKAKTDMLASLLRDQNAFAAVESMLSADALFEWHSGRGLVYDIARKYFQKHHRLPSRTRIENALEEAVQDDPHLLTPKRYEEAKGLIKRAFGPRFKDMPPEELYETGVDNAKRFMKEVAAEQLRQQVLDDDIVPTDLPSLLTEINQKVEVIDAVGADHVGSIFPEGWDQEEKIPKRPTGNEALDFFLGGGDSEGQVNIFMGPYGTCKTLLAVQCVCASINSAIAAEEQGLLDGKRPLCVLASYEAGVAEFRKRCLAFMAQVPFDKLMNMTSLKDLVGRNEKRQKYEKREFKGEHPVSEQQRVLNAAKMVEKYVWFIDLSSGEGKGGGGIPELAGILRKRLDRENVTYWTVWIDHADAMADEHMEANDLGTDKDVKRTFLKRLPLMAQRRIAKAMKTRVWVLHQLAGETNARQPTAFIHHTDSAECKSFAQYASFAIVTGNQDGEARCVWRVTKHRGYRPPQKELVMQIDGSFSRVRNISKDFAVDYNQHQIVPRKGGKSKGGDSSSRCVVSDPSLSEELTG